MQICPFWCLVSVAKILAGKKYSCPSVFTGAISPYPLGIDASGFDAVNAYSQSYNILFDKLRHQLATGNIPPNMYPYKTQVQTTVL